MTTRPFILYQMAAVVIFIGAVGVIAGGAGWGSRHWNHTPDPTKRNWSAKDIIGSWKYESRSGHGSTITITFNSDGTFDQVVGLYGTKTISHNGRWTIRTGSDPSGNSVYGKLQVHNALMETGGVWQPYNHSIGWDVIDSTSRRGGLSILGGPFPDPDGYQEFIKLP